MEVDTFLDEGFDATTFLQNFNESSQDLLKKLHLLEVRVKQRASNLTNSEYQEFISLTNDLGAFHKSFSVIKIDVEALDQQMRDNLVCLEGAIDTCKSMIDAILDSNDKRMNTKAASCHPSNSTELVVALMSHRFALLSTKQYSTDVMDTFLRRNFRIFSVADLADKRLWDQLLEVNSVSAVRETFKQLTEKKFSTIGVDDFGKMLETVQEFLYAVPNAFMGVFCDQFVSFLDKKCLAHFSPSAALFPGVYSAFHSFVRTNKLSQHESVCRFEELLPIIEYFEIVADDMIVSAISNPEACWDAIYEQGKRMDVLLSLKPKLVFETRFTVLYALITYFFGEESTLNPSSADKTLKALTNCCVSMEVFDSLKSRLIDSHMSFINRLLTTRMGASAELERAINSFSTSFRHQPFDGNTSSVVGLIRSICFDLSQETGVDERILAKETKLFSCSNR
ncbi:hypothetical protein PCE1_003986 [Barthelona sp. PCE]